MPKIRVISNGHIKPVPQRMGWFYLWGIELHQGTYEALYRPIIKVTTLNGYTTIELMEDWYILISPKWPFIKLDKQVYLYREDEVND